MTAAFVSGLILRRPGKLFFLCNKAQLALFVLKSVSTRAVVLHAISPISMKLRHFKGSAPKLKKTNLFLFWFFSGGR